MPVKIGLTSQIDQMPPAEGATVAWAVSRVPLELWARLVKRSFDEQAAILDAEGRKARDVDAVLIDAIESYLRTPIRPRRAA